MASQSISEFPALAAGQVASNDLLPIVDVSDLSSPGGTTKKLLASSYGQFIDQRLGVFNVKDPSYGATGDGLTDDTAAIQAAIAAATATGGIVYFPIGSYVVSSQLVITGGVTLRGGGSGYGTSNTCLILWMGTGFCIKMGNTAGALSYGMEVSNLRIALLTTNSGIWLYGAAHSAVRNVDIEGVVSTTASIGVQIDGANISSFFVTLDSIQCNHVFKGFVHTTTGTTQPTQVLATNCTALCDQTPLSIGIEIQSVAGVGCGDGVSYVSGNMEACATGVLLNGGSTSLIGVRFENTQGVASDVTFGLLGRNNNVIGCLNIYTLTDLASSYTNQVIACTSDSVNVISQMNRLDALTIGEDLTFLPRGTVATNILLKNATGTYTGSLFLQAGSRSAGFGGSLTMYGHAHASHPGDVVAGLSAGSAGKFRVNSQALDGGTDEFVVDPTGTGVTTILGFSAATVTAVGGFGCNGKTSQTAVATVGAAPAGGTGATAGAYDTAAHRDALIALVNTMRTALIANGILS